MWFIGAEVKQETSAPPPQKNPGSAPAEGGGDGLKRKGRWRRRKVLSLRAWFSAW